MKKIAQKGFTVELEGSALVLRSGEFKYTVGFNHDVSDIEDGYVNSRLELDDSLTLEVNGETHADFTSEILYQLRLNIEEVLDEVKEHLDEVAKSEHHEELLNQQTNNAYYLSTRGI